MAIAAALKITQQAVWKRANKETWLFDEQPVRGGRKRLYTITTLPADVQSALAGTVLLLSGPAPSAHPDRPAEGFSSAGRDDRAVPGTLPAAAPAERAGLRSIDGRAESLARVYEAAPESRKARARAALDAVAQYFDLVSRGFKARIATATVAQERAISAATLERQVAKVKREPRALWLYLLLDGNRGRTAVAEFSAEAREILKADYLRRPARTASACIEGLIEANNAGGLGWALPSKRTMLRFLNTIPRDVRVLARQGRDELLKLYPPQQRTKAALQALDIINGDGYAHKGIWVQFEDGEIRRARTWFWADVHSSKILAWRTDKTEHTELIRLSFGDLIEEYGIPRAVLLDNTRAAANKAMSGGVPHRFRFKVKDEEPDGVFKLLGIERVMWATPAHGQAKPIERAFGIGGMREYVDRAPDWHGAWDESEQYNGKTRPVPVAELERVIKREVAAMNARTGRRGAMHRGRSWDEVFAESWASATIRRATAEQRRLWLLCSEPTTVHRDGTIVLDAGRLVGEHRANRYWARELGEYVGKMVAARFDPVRLHEGVHLYTADGRYIAYGECLEPAGFNDGNAAREHARDRKRLMKVTREALHLETRMTSRAAGERLDAARSGGTAERTLPAPKVVEGIFRDPLERPTFVVPAAAPAEELELAPIASRVNVLAMHSDAERHEHWLALDDRRKADALADADEQFWRHWQTQDYFLEMQRLEADFAREKELRSA